MIATTFGNVERYQR